MEKQAPTQTKTHRIILNPKKLLKSKWTALLPINKEKHFMVTKIILPDLPANPIEYIELEAIYSKRKQLLLWQQLSDQSIWVQGWL